VLRLILSGAGVEHEADVVERAQAAADGQGHEAFAGGALHDRCHYGRSSLEAVMSRKTALGALALFWRGFDGVAASTRLTK